jgi:small subunit ribosomal protein S11e
MDPQTERAYQKQKGNFLVRKAALATKTKNENTRLVKRVGLGFKTPREARELPYVDKKCPFAGNVSIRGRILTGVVKTLKMQRTCTLRRDYLHYIKKYNRYEKRHKNISAHVSPAFRDIAVGDVVTVGQCRPLSKTVRFNVLKVAKVGGANKKQFKKF